jgi:hypothetical protein
MGYVHELKISGLESAAGADGRWEGLVHDRAYYTVIVVPESDDRSPDRLDSNLSQP